MSDYDDLIKRVQPYYNDLPIEGMKVLDELVNAIMEARKVAIEECAKAVPTNWCDSLLTGPKGERVPLSAGGVERLLRGIQDRIRTLALSGENSK